MWRRLLWKHSGERGGSKGLSGECIGNTVPGTSAHNDPPCGIYKTSLLKP
jgi:hypothetical protein